MNQRFTTLFILNLSLGLSGFVALNSFKMSMESSLQTRSRIILGADFGLSARHPLSVKTRQLVDSSFSSPAFVSETIELYSMVSSSKKKSFLVQVKAIDAQFPLYGSIKVSGSPLEQSTVSLAISKRSTQPLAWIYPEILSQLEVTVGDYLKVGEAQFKIAGIIVDDPSAGIGTTMAPRIYISLTDIPSTKLINEESIVRYSLLYALPKLKESQLEEMEKSLYLHPLMPQDVEVYSHRTAGEELGRLIDYLGDYLSLVSLSALFLCSLGAIFLFRSYFSSKIHQMAILLSLGLSPLRLMVLLLWQMGILGFLASVPAIGLSLILVPFISLITQHLLPIHLETPIEGSAMVVAMVISTLGGMLVCFPTVLGVKNIKPTSLFRLRYQEPVPGKFFRTLLAYFPAIFSFWLLSVWQSHSWQVGSLFILLLAIAGSFLWAFGFFVLKWLQHRVPQGSPFLTLALRDLTRHYYPTLTIFLALGLGIVLLNIVPQIQANLHGEMVQPEKSQLPSFFLFDIQEEQVADLKKLLSEAQVRLEQLAPLVRARLMEVNGKIFEKKKSKNFSREEEREARFRNRGFNLTYRAKLSNSEQLDSGAEFAGSYDPSKGKLPGISVEKRFANRLGLKIGDILTFDIQDVSVKGEIVNFRTVRWTSFNPNFFIQFQPGVLETAPKTYLLLPV